MGRKKSSLHPTKVPLDSEWGHLPIHLLFIEGTGFGRQQEDYRSVQWTVVNKEVPVDWYSYPSDQPVDYKQPMDYKSLYPSDPGGIGCPPPRWGPEELDAHLQSYWPEQTRLNEDRAQQARWRAQQWTAPTVDSPREQGSKAVTNGGDDGS
uniref:Uncharacterized protein n=1 Tax=Sphaerodactylus townsendi TaxID=933632 RepID=A0ACB8EUB1_9SAUR